MNIIQTALLKTAEDLLSVLTDECDVDTMKAAVASLVLEHLELHEPAPGSEQKIHLINAVGTLCRKGDAGERLTVVDLRTSVSSLAAATTADSTPPSDIPPGRVCELITYEVLLQMAQGCVARFSGASQTGPGLLENPRYSEVSRTSVDRLRRQKNRFMH